MDVLVTDKTGTLTEGRISFAAAMPRRHRQPSASAAAGAARHRGRLRRGRLRRGGGNPLDARPVGGAGRTQGPAARYGRLRLLPFDHERRMTSALVATPGRDLPAWSPRAPRRPSSPAARGHPEARATMLDAVRRRLRRVVAVATRPAGDAAALRAAPTSRTWTLAGFLVFLDPPKRTRRQLASSSSRRSASRSRSPPGTTPRSPRRSARTLGVALRRRRSPAPTWTPWTTTRWPPRPARPRCFARVSPEQKARVVRLLRRRRARGGLPRRRRQRRPGAARRRRRHLGRHRHRRRQGRRRRHPAREGPRGAGRRGHGGPADLRQHDQVRADGHVEQLRQHVQRGGGLGGAAVPAHAAVADPAQQPALRHRPARHPVATRWTRSSCAPRRTGTSTSSAGSWSSSARSARCSTS